MLAVQAACYAPAFCEPPAVWQARLARTAGHWRVAVDAHGGLCAYLAAYPSTWGAVTPLHGPFAPAEAADTVYLHDLAVHSDAAGQGLGQALIEGLLAQARDAGLRQAALVAVGGAGTFWQRRGFVAAAPAGAAAQAALAGYGAQAVYMRRALDTP